MARPDLLTVGEAFEDLIFIGLPMLPRPGEEVKTSRLSSPPSGAEPSSLPSPPRDSACRAASSPASATPASCGSSAGVSVANLRHAGEPHAISAALSTGANHSFVTFNGINDVLNTHLPAALEREDARHVHFAFYPHSCALWEAHVLALKQRRITTSWDFGWNESLLNDRRLPHLLRSLDYVFLNEQEAVLYARRHDLDAALAVWRDAPTNIIVKLGAKGSCWLGQRTDLHAPTRKARVVDTTGAGDAFNGGFLAGLLRGFGHSACLRLGNFVGTLSTRKAGGLDGLPALSDVPPAFADLVQAAAPAPVPLAPADTAHFHSAIMKLAIIGGAGIRVPLLVNGLVQSDLPISDIALYDVNQERLRIIGQLASPFGHGAARRRLDRRRGRRGGRFRLHQHPRRRHRGSRARQRSPSRTVSSGRRRWARAASRWRCGPCPRWWAMRAR